MISGLAVNPGDGVTDGPLTAFSFGRAGRYVGLFCHRVQVFARRIVRLLYVVVVVYQLYNNSS